MCSRRRCHQQIQPTMPKQVGERLWILSDLQSAGNNPRNDTWDICGHEAPHAAPTPSPHRPPALLRARSATNCITHSLFASHPRATRACMCHGVRLLLQHPPSRRGPIVLTPASLQGEM